MSDNSIVIGDDTYPLGAVILYSMPQQENGRTFLSIDINATSEGDTAGLAINCLSLLEQSSIEEIQGQHFRFSRAEDNPNIELGESVIVKPGVQLFDLELSELSLIFGHFDRNRIPVEMTGVCFNLLSSEVKMHARFEAELK